MEGPYVQFTDGSAQRITDESQLPEGLATDPDLAVAKIWDLGELLVPVGEFLENNHTLAPSPVKEWHEQVLDDVSCDSHYPSKLTESFEHSKFGIPLAPEFVTYYNEINTTELALLYRNTSIDMSQGRITIHNDGKEIAYRLALDISKEGHLSGPKSELWAWIVSNAPEPQESQRKRLRLG